MARFSGLVGYAFEQVETAPDVYTDHVVEFPYFGDVVRNTRRSQEGEYVNNDISVSNSIEIVADAYANEHFFAIRYVEWSGQLWSVEEVEVVAPRLRLRLGGVYRGVRADRPSTPGP